MATGIAEPGRSPARRRPRRLLLAFLGEFVAQDADAAVRTGVFLEVLRGAGVAAPAVRANLDRMVANRLLMRERRGRQLEFSLTPAGHALLGEAAERVRGTAPFEPNGDGWTLVTFSLPEELRTLRSRLRSTLTWHGFAPLRDGLWLASGSPALATALEPLHDELPPGALTAFRAQELDGFPIAASVRDAWDIEGIRDAHHSFIDTWSGRDPDAASAVVTLTMLVADWLALLRADPRLPAEYMGQEWPAASSLALYRRLRDQLAARSQTEFAELIGETAAP